MAPGKYEVRGGHRASVAPAGVFPEPEGGAVVADLPALRYAGDEPTLAVKAGEGFHHVPEDAGADLIRGLAGVELGWFLGKDHANDPAFEVHGVIRGAGKRRGDGEEATQKEC